MGMNQKIELIDSLTTTTWYEVRAEIIDQVFQITPLYDLMVEKGRIKERVPDGTHFEIPVRYDKQDQNRQWIGKGDTFGKAEKEWLTRLIFYVRTVGTSIPRFFDDEVKNKGKAKIISYVEELVQTTKDSMIDGFETDLWVQNADPKAMTALPTLVSTTPTTGSIGGLSRSSESFLQNNVKDFTNLTTAANLLDEMTRMYNLCSIWKSGKRRNPDIILTTREVYQDYERIARALQVIQTSKSERASLGFGDLQFKGIDIYWAPQCPSGTMLFLNTEHLELCYDPEVWFEMTQWKEGQDNVDRVAQVLCRCNLICDNFRKQGVIHNITTVTS
jgi:hypothetical protein